VTDSNKDNEIFAKMLETDDIIQELAEAIAEVRIKEREFWKNEVMMRIFMAGYYAGQKSAGCE
jgi:hypothetical protein